MGRKPDRTADPRSTRSSRLVLVLTLAVTALLLVAVYQAWGRRAAALPESAEDAQPRAGAAAALASDPWTSTADPEDERSTIRLDEPASHATLEVRVEDGAGAGIGEAFVWLRRGDARELDGRRPLDGGTGGSAGWTAASGLARLQAEASEAEGEFWVLAKAEGFQEGQVRLEEPLPRRTTVRLEPSPGIAGVVLRADGLPVGAGIRVVASPREIGPVNREMALRAIEGSPLVHSTETAEDGSFRLTTVRAGTSYHLQAGGRGMATTGTRPGVSLLAEAGASDVELTLYHLYQCFIEHLDQDGEPVLSALFSTADPTSIGSLDARLRTCSTLHAAALLAGQDPALAELPRHIFWHLFESDEALDPAGPVDLRQRTVGYAPVNAEFYARPLTQEASIERLHMQGMAAGFTELTVRFVRGGEPALSVPGRLEFAEADRRSTFSVFWSGDGSTEPARLTSFPQGRYSWRFLSTRGPFRFPPVDQSGRELDTARDQELVIELDATGSLLVELYEPDGEPYRGLASMLIEPGLLYTDTDGVIRGGGSQMVSSRGPPFRIEGLPTELEMELVLLNPASGGQPGADRFQFQIEESGGEARVEARLRATAARPGD